jgi:HK97 gp10 family phage protein
MGSTGDIVSNLAKLGIQAGTEELAALPGQLSSSAQFLQGWNPEAAINRLRSASGLRGGGRYSAEVVVGVPYGRYVEFGTAFMAAEPFLRPAMRVGGEALAKELKARLPRR